jgi:hypothetical protein
VCAKQPAQELSHYEIAAGFRVAHQTGLIVADRVLIGVTTTGILPYHLFHRICLHSVQSVLQSGWFLCFRVGWA